MFYLQTNAKVPAKSRANGADKRRIRNPDSFGALCITDFCHWGRSGPRHGSRWHWTEMVTYDCHRPTANCRLRLPNNHSHSWRNVLQNVSW